MMTALSNQAHETFCLHYVNGEEVGNGTAAAREAFPKQTNGAVRVNAVKLLTKANIQTRIDELFEVKRSHLQFDADRWDREAIAATFTNLGHFLDWDADKVTLKSKADIKPEHLPGLQSITIERGPFGITKTRVQLHSKHAMLNLCALRLGLFRQLTPTGELWVGGTFHRGDQTHGGKKKTDGKGKGGRVAKTRKGTHRATAQAAPGRGRGTREKDKKGTRRAKGKGRKTRRGAPTFRR